MKTPPDNDLSAIAAEPSSEINLDGFRDAACGDENERIELLQMYEEQLKQKLPQAESAARNNQLQDVARIIHSLTGATYTCGLHEFATNLRSLEQSAKNGDSDAAQALLPELLNYATRLHASISAELSARQN